ncbi:MAG: nonstructural protein [Arizlama microvirus]|nr:MAG: nonstructural protein [Arizlama microvirus]
MVVNLYSIYDEKACFFQFPFPAKTRSEAVRMVTDALNTPDTLIAKHPEDFSLYELGTFNDADGVYTPRSQNYHICLLSALLPASGSPGAVV